MEKKDIILSASRIKTLETCSWTYWCNYHLKIPDKQNEGAARGTVCHLIFELLLKKKHKKHLEKIVKKNTIKASKAVDKLVIKSLHKTGFFSLDNYKMVDEMILVGLNNDFLLSETELHGKVKIGEAEQEFLIDNENPKYKIKGFIDKNGFYPDASLFKIVDYKSSKAKFKDDELTANIQAMTYTLASKKAKNFSKLKDKIKKIIVEFIFLRFPKQPVQQVEISEEQLAGFEQYLGYIYEITSNFSEEHAKLNFAKDSENKKWLCKAGKTWVCPLMKPFSFFKVFNENGIFQKSYFEDSLPKNLPENWKAERTEYAGCPAHTNTSQQKTIDPFDF